MDFNINFTKKQAIKVLLNSLRLIMIRSSFDQL